MNRRNFLKASAIVGGAFAIAPSLGFAYSKGNPKIEGYAKWQLTEAQWKKRLTPFQYAVLRDEETERAFSNPMERNKKKGSYHCAGCDLKVYSSEHKYDSGTGWPSFYQPIEKRLVGTKTDYKAVWPRTEVHCARCGGHQGHVFKDGPKPTGLRYCINAAAPTFKAA